jgi:hypothetical protein
VAEARPLPPRALQLEYRFDRLLSDKLAQAFQVLVPDQRRPVSTAIPNRAPQTLEVRSEQTSCDLRPGLFGSTEGEPHDSQPDGSSVSSCVGTRIRHNAGMGF